MYQEYATLARLILIVLVQHQSVQLLAILALDVVNQLTVPHSHQLLYVNLMDHALNVTLIQTALAPLPYVSLTLVLVVHPFTHVTVLCFVRIQLVNA